ncbi:MAG TPA: DUF1801 domain-containing protein [Pyrinomonadaceae bacterium]
MKTDVPKTVDEYLASVSDEQRVALEKLRKTIRAAAPKAIECISYQMPTFKQNGMLVSFGAWRDHCSFYPGAKPIEDHRDELKDFELSKGTIRFRPDKPIPASLVRRMVKGRIAENERRAAAKKR